MANYYNDNGIFSVEINSQPQQTQMRVTFETGLQYQWPSTFIWRDTAYPSCCYVVPSNNWIITDDVMPGYHLPDGSKLIAAKLKMPYKNTQCITHCSYRMFDYSIGDYTEFSAPLELKDSITPQLSTRSVAFNPSYVPTGSYAEYEVYLICNSDMPVTYNSSTAYPYNDTNYTIRIFKAVQYFKQANGEECQNSVEAFQSDNALNINARLTPEYAQQIILTISNSVGEIMATETYNLTTGNNFTFNTSSFPKGTYYFNITTNTGEQIFSDKFIVVE